MTDEIVVYKGVTGAATTRDLQDAPDSEKIKASEDYLLDKSSYAAFNSELRDSGGESSLALTVAHLKAGATTRDAERGDEMKAFYDVAVHASPELLRQAVADGKLTQETADALMVVQTAAYSQGATTRDKLNSDLLENTMVNFYRLSKDDQKFAVDQMSQGMLQYKVKIAPNPNMPDTVLETLYTSRQNTTKAQQTIAYFLATRGPEDSVANLEDIVNDTGTFDDDPAARTFYALGSLQHMDSTQKKSVLGYFKMAATPLMFQDFSDPTGGIAASEAKDSRLHDELMSLDETTLAFLIGQNNIKLTGEDSRVKGTKQYQDMLEWSDGTNAMAALTAAQNPSSDGKTDISKVTFVDHNGETVNLMAWCKKHGIPLPAGELEGDDRLKWEELESPGTHDQKAKGTGKKHKENEKRKKYREEWKTATEAEKQAFRAKVAPQQAKLSSAQVDALNNSIKSWQQKHRDMNQLEANYIARNAQLTQVYQSMSTNMTNVGMSLLKNINEHLGLRG